MTPSKSTINQLFNGTRVFKIPFYQRSYVWDEPQWSRFVADMVSVGHQAKDYFLGAIILKQVSTNMALGGDYKIVIDGQQRLTTIAVFLKVLYLKLGNNAWFARKFILPDDTLAIQHSHIDRDDFEKVMRLENYVEKVEGSGNIVKAYNYFSENVDPAALNMDRFSNNVQVIDIVIDDKDDEQQIFDTINSLGVDLTTAELLKNHLFTEESFEQYKQLWVPAFEKDEERIAFWSAPLLKGRTQRKNVEAFLNAFLQIKVHEPGRPISAEEKLEYAKASALFYNYKKFISTYYPGAEFSFIRELTEYAEIYAKIFTPDVAERSLSSHPGINRINFLIYVSDGTTMMPFVMYVVKHVSDEQEQVKIFDYLESYFVRRLICKKSTKSYSDLFSENLIYANVNTAQDFIDYINSKDETNALAMPNNRDVLSAFRNIEQPNYRGLQILYLLESRMRSNHLYTTQLLKYNAYTLEHLMPQKWDKWPLPENVTASDRIHKIKTVGNFTMLTQSLNSKISNNIWSIKLNGKGEQGGLREYATGLLTLADVLDMSVWDEEAINLRANWLAQEATTIWVSHLPNEISIDEPSLEDDVQIEIDPSTGIQRVSKDHSKFSLDGNNFMLKSYFVPYFIGKYIEKHKMTFAEIKQRFPDDMLESRYRFLGLICPVSAYEQWEDNRKQMRYHPERPGSKLVSSDGIEFYVSTQWSIDSIQSILQIAREDGWQVTVQL